MSAANPHERAVCKHGPHHPHGVSRGNNERQDFEAPCVICRTPPVGDAWPCRRCRSWICARCWAAPPPEPDQADEDDPVDEVPQ